MTETIRPLPEPAIGMSPEAWLEASQRPRLSDSVPLDVRDYFAIARGTMAYGAFSLSCLHFGGDQVLRAAECAVRHRCRQIGILEDFLPLSVRIERLHRAGAISDDARARWSDARRLRNHVGHRVRAEHGPPQSYLDRLDLVANLVNEHFVGQPVASTETEAYLRAPSNWLLPSSAFAAYSSNNWFERLERPKLADGVPNEISRLFNDARESLRFGRFYLPLCNLVGEMFHHLAVLAIETRCAAIVGARSARRATALERIRILRGDSPIEDSRARSLELAVELRNAASHPDFQVQVPPTWHLRGLEVLADDLNALFA